MDFRVKTSELDKVKSDCLIVQVYGDKSFSAAAKQVDELNNGSLTRLLELGDLPQKPGSSAWLNQSPFEDCPRILVVCMAASLDKLGKKEVEAAAASASKALLNKEIKHAAWSVECSSTLAEQHFALLLAQSVSKALYQYEATKTQNIKKRQLKKLTLHSQDKLSANWKKGLGLGAGIGAGINKARELGNLPGNICTPRYLADQAEAMGKDQEKLKVTVLDEKQIKKLKMGSFLSVAAGSAEPPRLIVLEYSGGAKSEKPKVLVGKGITFDTGGISLKPGAGMDEMKFDMCGAASVMGVMQALVETNANVNVVGIIAAAENMPSSTATKPGDVVTSMSGQTIEILNTDAEGRLVLCDALSYAARYKPESIIDIATLTGACIIALGHHRSGLMANNQDLADELLAAGSAALDNAWQLPLGDEYQKSLDSNFADIANIGGRDAGTITAACFLSRFTKDQKWAHLDIAGTAWNSGQAKGATGRPVPLLCEYLLKAYSE